MNYASVVNPNPATIPQRQPLDDRQVENDAGGYVYSIGRWGQLDRLLLIGTEGGTYYANEQKHTKRNYDALKACLAEDGARAVGRIREVSVGGLAPKQDAAIFALAVACTSTDPDTRHWAQSAINDVCRTASTLMLFLEQYKGLGGKWPRSMRTAVQGWYGEKSVESLAYQTIKYRTRNGWSHRDILRLAHLKPSGAKTSLLHWLVKDEWEGDEKPRMVEGFFKAQECKSAKDVAKVIAEYGIPREAVPTEFLKTPEVWDALLPSMPMTAMIRNLGNMSAAGLLVPGSVAAFFVGKRLHDAERMTKARIHPLNVLMAMRQYGLGRGLRGSNTWNAVSSVLSDLDDAFYMAFKGIQPTGKRFLLGLDCSPSMGSGSGISGLTAREVAGALAMVWAATEPVCEVMGFGTSFRNLGFTRKMSLADATGRVSGDWGGTDCSLPYRYASQVKQDFDVFVVITDNETHSGSMHPKVALAQYRNQHVKDARQIVLGVTATDFSIADPNDPLSLDIAGFGSDVPAVLNAFVGGPQASMPSEDEGESE